MRLIPKMWLALVAVALVPCALAAASFTAALDRDSMTLGEQATLSLKFEDAQPKDAPGIPNIAGLQFQYVGPSSSFSFINGQTSSSITYTYLVTAQRDGEFTIPGCASASAASSLPPSRSSSSSARPARPRRRGEFRQRVGVPEIGFPEK